MTIMQGRPILWGQGIASDHVIGAESWVEPDFQPPVVYQDLTAESITVPGIVAGPVLTSDFFQWLQATHSPTWLQPLDEASGSTATSGMAGPNSSSVTSVTFGEPGLVESDRTAALFNKSRIVYPKSSVTDRMHQAAGGTIMFWAKADAALDNERYVIFTTNGHTGNNVGIAVDLEDTYSFDSRFDKCFRVFITNGLGPSRFVYSNASGGSSMANFGVLSPPGVILPGVVQFFAITHSGADNILRLYVDGSEVVSVSKGSESYASATAKNDTSVGVLRPTDFLGPHKGLLQGLTFIPSILTPAQISEIYTRSGI